MKKLFFISICSAAIIPSRAQTVSSPYSIIGIGDIEQRNVSKYAGMASVSIAQRSPFYINTFNPASLTAMPKHMVLFEINGKGRTASFRVPGTDTATSSTKDFTAKRISFAYKVSEKTAFSFGLQPYSSVNYSFSSIQKLGADADAYLRTVTGSGGLNQAYISLARQLTKQFSVGVTSSYLFGSLNQKVNYYNSGLGLDITQDNNVYLRNFNFTGGLQYESSPEKKVQHRFGATATLPVNMLRSQSYKILEAGTDVTTEQITNTQPYNLPLKAGFGYSATFNKTVSLSADYTFQNWKNSTTPIANTSIIPSQRVAVGVEYGSIKKLDNYAFEKYFLQAGVFYENTYLKVAGNQLKDYGFTLGGGFNLGRINVYGAYELGRKGNYKLQQIAENYSQFSLGITFKDIWEKSRYARYQ